MRGSRWGGRGGQDPPSKIQISLIYIIKLPRICLGPPSETQITVPHPSGDNQDQRMYPSP